MLPLRLQARTSPIITPFNSFWDATRVAVLVAIAKGVAFNSFWDATRVAFNIVPWENRLFQFLLGCYLFQAGVMQ